MVTTFQRPTTNNKEGWNEYWNVQGLTWRTEPEISVERQKYLAERRAIVPDVEKGIYPFKDIEPKLTRADVEWLLVTHENGRGPVDWNDESQYQRKGLNLRGVRLCGVHLSNLPLANLNASLTLNEWNTATPEQREAAAVHLEAASLFRTHLERAQLRGAHLEGARMKQTRLEYARLTQSHLAGTDLQFVRLMGAVLIEAHFIGKVMSERDLRNIQDWITDFPTILPAANLRDAYFDDATVLNDAILADTKLGSVCLSDVHWNSVNLAVVDWSSMNMLGDETEARQPKTSDGENKENATRLEEFRRAVRANRQLAVALQSQGLNEEAARFAYRAQLCQRIVLRYQKKFGQYLFSLFLYFLAGYGYRPGRSVIWYLATILVFALAYHFLGGLTLYPPDAFVFSIMSFHGRGFFPALSQEINLHNPLVMLAAGEAIVGLLIEISFIATFTQRFFGR